MALSSWALGYIVARDDLQGPLHSKGSGNKHNHRHPWSVLPPAWGTWNSILWLMMTYEGSMSIFEAARLVSLGAFFMGTCKSISWLVMTCSSMCTVGAVGRDCLPLATLPSIDINLTCLSYEHLVVNIYRTVYIIVSYKSYMYCTLYLYCVA